MPDDPTSSSASVSTAEALATLISTIAEQNRLIQLLTERVGALEGCSPSSRATTAGSPIPSTNDTQPIPSNDLEKDSNTPSQSRMLDGQTQSTSAEENSPEDSAVLPANSSVEHPPIPSTAPEANASAASSAPPTLSPAVPLRHEAPPFSPALPPPSFGYHHYLSAAGHAITSSHPDTPNHDVNPAKTSGGSSEALANDSVTTSLDQWSSEPATSWGEPEDSVQKSPSKPEMRLDSDDSPEPARGGESNVRPCRFGNECTRSDCWFEHPGRVNSAVRHHDNPNSTHAPGSEASNSEVASSSDVTAKQPRSSTRSRPECRYADNCTRKECWFTHPPGWSPPSCTSELTPDQGTPTPNNQPDDQGHTASSASNGWPVEDDGWGTKRQESTAAEANADLGTWGTPTIDDWGPSTNDDWGAPSSDGWASSAVKTAVAQAPSPASKSEQAPPARTPNSETRKGRRSRPARSRESTTSSVRSQSVRSQSVLSAATTQLETVDDVHDAVAEPPADASVQDPVIEISTADIIIDSMGTPPLEPAATPTRSSSLSEPESLSTPFSWGDEPLNDSSYIDSPTKDPTDLDAAAPSAMYTSWAPAEVSDWGPIAVDSWGDANGVDGTIPLVSQTEQERVGSQPSAKAKGKRKDTGQGKAATASQAKDKRKPTNEAGSSTASTSTAPHPAAEPAIPEPSPIPQGVPEEQIPDWLLGKGEDSYAVLGLSRPATPEPVPTPNPSPPKPGLNRPRLSQMPGESFPALKPTPAYRPPTTSVASGPVIQPARRTGWKIISGETPTASAPSKGGGQSSKKNYVPKKQAGKSSK